MRSKHSGFSLIEMAMVLAVAVLVVSLTAPLVVGSRERSLEVCMQCHLETTTNLLPHALRRSGRGYFSYDPAEPLAEVKDPAPTTP